MHIVTRMNKVVIEDYYHMTTLDENELDDTNTFIVRFVFNPWGPFYRFTYTSNLLIAFVNVNTREN